MVVNVVDEAKKDSDFKIELKWDNVSKENINKIFTFYGMSAIISREAAKIEERIYSVLALRPDLTAEIIKDEIEKTGNSLQEAKECAMAGIPLPWEEEYKNPTEREIDEYKPTFERWFVTFSGILCSTISMEFEESLLMKQRNPVFEWFDSLFDNDICVYLDSETMMKQRNPVLVWFEDIFSIGDLW